MGERAVGNLKLDHPSIVAVREIYRSVERMIETGRLEKEQRSVEDCGPFPEGRTIYAGEAGQIRKFVLDVGSDDSVLTIRHYYDEAEKLRFVFITGGAVNQTAMEQRIYFDDTGARIRDHRVFTAGPGYPFANFSDEEGLLSHDPRRAYEKSCA